MFITVTGTMGSGKTAYGVNTILTKENEYKNIYANFNGLKMRDNIKPFNFAKFRLIIAECKSIYDAQIASLGESGDTNIIDKPIIDYLLSIDFIELNPDYPAYVSDVEYRNNLGFLKRTFLNIFQPIKKVQMYKPNLFLMDEAQNHFPSIDPITGKSAAADPILIWGITYHRHLYMDVILFTQEYQQLHPSYLRNMQYFLDAVDSDNMLLGNKSPYFKYVKHMKTPYYKTNMAGRVKVKKSKDIFDSYESGDEVRTKSAVLPYVFMALGLLVLVAFIFAYAVSSLKGDSVDENLSVVPDSPLVKEVASNIVVKKYNSDGEFFYIKLNCIADTCVNKVHKINLNIDDLNATVSSTKSKILTVKKFSEYRGTLSLLVTEDFLNLFQGAKNGKNKGFNLLN